MSHGDIKVGDFASELTYKIEKGKTSGDAIEMFEKYNIKQIPVVEEGKIVGIFTTGDVANTAYMTRSGSDYFAGTGHY